MEKLMRAMRAIDNDKATGEDGTLVPVQEKLLEVYNELVCERENRTKLSVIFFWIFSFVIDPRVRMGRLSKDRRDIYYRLAKEMGFRARSAFKLLQIDQHFDILSGVSSVVDLCAAPGGWSQVLAQCCRTSGGKEQATPVRLEQEKGSPGKEGKEEKDTEEVREAIEDSTQQQERIASVVVKEDNHHHHNNNNSSKRKKPIIIAVDVAAMAPIAGVIALQGDITRERTAKEIIASAAGRCVDLVVCDGAPDVLRVHDWDEATQHKLVFAAVGITTCILKPGGTFVAKVFRGRDIFTVYRILNQLFRDVQVAKPKTSRNSSMEAFVVCRQYRPPWHFVPDMGSSILDVLARAKAEKETCLCKHKEEHVRAKLQIQPQSQGKDKQEKRTQTETRDVKEGGGGSVSTGREGWSCPCVSECWTKVVNGAGTHDGDEINCTVPFVLCGGDDAYDSDMNFPLTPVRFPSFPLLGMGEGRAEVAEEKENKSYADASRRYTFDPTATTTNSMFTGEIEVNGVVTPLFSCFPVVNRPSAAVLASSTAGSASVISPDPLPASSACVLPSSSSSSTLSSSSSSSFSASSSSSPSSYALRASAAPPIDPPYKKAMDVAKRKNHGTGGPHR